MNLRLEPHKNGNITGRKRSSQPVQIISRVLVHKRMGRSAKQMAHPVRNPSGFGLFVVSSKQTQVSGKGAGGGKRAALSLIEQQAARHVQHALT